MCRLLGFLATTPLPCLPAAAISRNQSVEVFQLEGTGALMSRTPAAKRPCGVPSPFLDSLLLTTDWDEGEGAYSWPMSDCAGNRRAWEGI